MAAMCITFVRVYMCGDMCGDDDVWRWWVYMCGDDGCTYVGMMGVHVWRWWVYMCGDGGCTYVGMMGVHVWRWWVYMCRDGGCTCVGMIVCMVSVEDVWYKCVDDDGYACVAVMGVHYMG